MEEELNSVGTEDTAIDDVNAATVATQDVATTDEDVPVVIDVLANDTDNDADTLSVTAVGAATNGEVVINADGTVTYTPNAGFSGEDSFTYTISDGVEEVTASVDVTVNNVNEAPIATEDTATTDEDVPLVIDVLANDTDADADELSVTAVGEATNGEVVINEDGTVTYTPNAGFSGEDSFTYTVSDGVEEVTASVDVTVNNVNEAPVATEDTATTDEDVPLVIDVLANDTDADADELSVTAVGEATNGEVVINEDGTVTYTPTTGFSGEDTFTYTVSDGVEEVTSSVTVTVNNVNEAPVAVEDATTTDENVPVIIDVLANDTDADGDALSVTAVGEATNGEVVINEDGTVTYTPITGFSGEDTFTYTVSDGVEETTSSVAITVNNINDAPIATDDSFGGPEDTVVTGNVLTNDNDPDGDALTVSLGASTVENGILALDGDGSFTYTPNASFSGTDAFSYEVSDGEFTATAVVTLAIDNINEAPVANADSFTGFEGAVFSGNVLANDTDIDSDALTVSLSDTGDVSSGTLNLLVDGNFTYTPDAVFVGTDSFTYVLSDGVLTDTAAVTLTVNNVNEAPVAIEDAATTDEDIPVVINVLANDTDADADVLSVIAVGAANNGEAVINEDGTITYTPTNGFSGEDTFTYTVSDGLEEVTASVAVTVNNVNEAPVAVEDAATTDEDVPVVIDVLTNDTDADGDNLSVTAVGEASNGEVVINDDGTVTYTPTEGFSGEDTFTYTVSDGLEEVSSSVTVTVNNVNEAPVAVEDAVTTDEDVPVTFDVLANDTDGDGDDLSVTAVGEASNGEVVINEDGTVTYTPTNGFSGEDTFTYTVSDGLEEVTASVAVTVNNVNEAPVAVEDAVTTDEDVAVTFDVLVNDTDGDGDDLSVTAVGEASNGEVVINEDGTVTYTPTAGFSGEDTFTYTVSDGLEEITSSVAVTVNNVNEAPVAVEDTATTDEDLPVVIDVLANDTDGDGDDLSVTAVGEASNGEAVINEDSTLTYNPTAGFSGEDTFTYTVSDGLEEVSSSVTVTVNNVNEAPVATEDAATTDEDVPVVIDVLANDTDADADDLSVTAVGEATNGTVDINDDGTVTYTPTNGFSGEDTFTYTVSDGVEEVTSSVSVTVNNVNEAPVAVEDTATTDEDLPVVIDVLANDTDADADDLSVTAVGEASNGEAVINDDGTVTYTPTAGFSGEDTFTYTVSDGLEEVTSSVSVTVNNVNEAPVAVEDTATTDEDVPVVIDVLANDTDADADDLSVTAVGAATNGEVVINEAGTVTYTPTTGFSGEDTFTYTVSDGLEEVTASVAVTVNNVNEAPVAVEDAATTDEDIPVVIDVLANDTDADADDLSVTAVGEATNGTVDINDDGTVTYTPTAGFSGEDTFTYTVNDGLEEVSSSVTVTVNNVNEAPVAVEDTATTDEDLPVVIDVLANDTDADADDLSVTAVGEASNGEAVINDDGTVTYTPTAGFSGEDTFTYTVSDGLEEVTSSVAVTVNNVNEAPVAVEDIATTDEDVPVSINVLANDTDADADDLSVTAVGEATNGTVDINDDGTVTYTPTEGFSGEDTFTYTVSDGLEEVTASVAVTVNNVNEAPVAVEDTATTDEDVPVTINVLANDSDADADDLSVTAVGAAANGEVVINEDGTVTYTPTNGFSGEDSFTYTVSDGLEEVTSSVAVTVNNVNEAPVAVEDTAITDEDEPVVINVLANDTDADADDLSVTAVGAATNGEAVINEDGTVTYTPTNGFSGEDTFTYTVSDGVEEVTSSVAVTVNNINEAPIAIEDTATTDEDIPVVIDVLANDTDADADALTVTAVGAASNGEAVINDDGTVTYTPTAGFSGEDTFTYTVSDGVEEVTAAVTVAVGALNAAPVAVDDTFDSDQGLSISGNVLSNDSDPNGDVLVVGLSDTDTVENGILELNQDGSFVYAPNEGFTGTDSFSYLLSDGLLTDTATVTLNINGNGGPDTPTTLGLFDYEEFLRFENISAVVPTDEVGGLALAQLFDESFYLDQNPDVLAALSNGQLSSGYAHFVSSGISEGRAPSILYDEAFYLEMNADIAAAVNEGSLSSGLAHFLNVGHLENRDPSRVFSQEDYLTNNLDISTAVEDGLIGSGFEHFVESGAEENRLPLSLYDESFYLVNNPDIAAAVASGQLNNGLEHFVLAGQSEGRAPSSLYNETSYLSLNSDVATAVADGSFSSGFEHYERFGRFEGRAVFA